MTPTPDERDEEVRKLIRRLPINHPKVIFPSNMRRDIAYLLATKLGAKYDIVGPFTTKGAMKEVIGMPPFDGHYEQLVTLHDGTITRIVIPQNGIAIIYGLQYSLHEANSETEAYFARVNGITDEWLRQQLGTLTRHDNKYLL